MRRTLAATLIGFATLTALATGGSAGHSATGTYTLATTPGVSVVCSPDCLGTGVNFGGYTFAASPELPASVAVADASGGAVPFTVCQDVDADGRCGNANPALGPLEPRVVACAAGADLTASAVPFVADVEVSVFVRALDPACTGAASSGTITLTYA